MAENFINWDDDSTVDSVIKLPIVIMNVPAKEEKYHLRPPSSLQFEPNRSTSFPQPSELDRSWNIVKDSSITSKPDITKIGRDLCRVKKDTNKDKKGGYIVKILTEKMTERDKVVLICKNCEGIMKEACISSNGEHLCSGCDKGDRDSKQIPNWAVREMINSLKCSCPLFLRGCLWLGTLEKCENHLDTCGYVYRSCRLGCGELLKREELGRHEKENCTQRLVKCDHCDEDFISCELEDHLDKCTRMKVPCDLCSVEKYRKDMTQHLEDDCLEKMLDCPFAEYKCLVRIKRKDIDKHLEEKETKHLGLKLEDFISKQSEIINKQSEEINILNVNIEKQNKEMKTEKSNTSKQIELLYLITKTTKIIWKIEDVTDLVKCDFSSSNKFKQCAMDVAGYRFALKFDNSRRLIIVFPGTTIKPDRTLMVNCHIVLHSRHIINCGIIEVKQKDILRGYQRSIASISQEDIDKYSEPQFPGAAKRDLTLEIFITMQ